MAAAAISFASMARAAEPGVEFGWEVVSGCPDRAWARRSVAAYLGAKRGAVHTPVRVVITRDQAEPARFLARITTQGRSGTGERTFDGPTCTSVAKAATLVVAMAVDPLTVSRRVHVVEPSIEVGVGPAVSGDLGSLPEPSLGAGLFVALRSGAFSVDLTALAWLPRLEIQGPRAGTGGLLGLYTAGLRGCWAGLDLGPTEIGACVTAEAGIATGHGVNLAFPESSQGAWAAALAGLVVRARLGPIRPWISLDAGLPVVRPTFEIEGFGDVFRASPVIARASIAVAWIFP